jgi:hypothetical protein
MPFLQKLTSIVYPHILEYIYKVGVDYDWKNDPKGVKSKRVRKHTVGVLTSLGSNNNSFIDNFLSQNAYTMYTNLIPQAIREVDNDKGVLTANVVRGDKGQPVLNIYDTSLATGTALPKKYTKNDLLTFLAKK